MCITYVLHEWLQSSTWSITLWLLISYKSLIILFANWGSKARILVTYQRLLFLLYSLLKFRFICKSCTNTFPFFSCISYYKIMNLNTVLSLISRIPFRVFWLSLTNLFVYLPLTVNINGYLVILVKQEGLGCLLVSQTEALIVFKDCF